MGVEEGMPGEETGTVPANEAEDVMLSNWLLLTPSSCACDICSVGTFVL